MADYICLMGNAQTPPAAAMLAQLEAHVARQSGWCWALRAEDRHVLVRETRALRVRRFANGGLLLGDLWDRAGVPLDPMGFETDGTTTRDLARSLIAKGWGRYVAILGAVEAPEILRDPSGSLEAFTWRRAGMTLVASGLPSDLHAIVAPRLRLDWRQVAGFLANPASLSGHLALEGITPVAPGDLLTSDRQVEALWRPRMFLADPPPSRAAAEGRFVRLVDMAVGAMTSDRGPLIAELSGGLDSAIVAAALLKSDADVAQWLNYYGAGAESDERAYALAFGQLHGQEVTCVAKPFRPLTAEDLAVNAASLRPSLMGLDVLRDRDVAARGQALGARAIVTGQGGDAVFLQRLTGLALADQVRSQGLSALRVTPVRDLADWTGMSVWSVLRQALSGAPYSPISSGGPSFMGPAARDFPQDPHPWLVGLTQISPGKRQHIERLVQAQLVVGDCVRARTADLLHPLLAQPLVEFSLSVPTYVLTGLKRDRDLARRAFSSRLPDAIVNRRTKGDMTAHYGRWVNASLPFLRSFLLDGQLAARGVVDRAKLEALLTPEQLIWGADYVAILFAAVLEAWASHWQARLAEPTEA